MLMLLHAVCSPQNISGASPQNSVSLTAEAAGELADQTKWLPEKKNKN